MKRSKIEIDQNKAGQWYWRLVAANGETVSPSESFDSYSNALRAAKSLKRWVRFARIEKV